MDNPVLLIIFNRFETTYEVFEAIRKEKPNKLYVYADGPRYGNENDAVKCNKTREIVKNVDWDCEVHYRFEDDNLGCGYGPATAISWAFEKEKSLIILEDDCVPSPPFFGYCNYSLEKYADDERVFLISGRSHHEGSKEFNDNDYIFSSHGHTWGWATWKRCWDEFDINMTNWDDYRKCGGFLNSFMSEQEGNYYNNKYDELTKDNNLVTHVWDCQLLLAMQIGGGLSIVPSKNLIHNIGAIGVHSTGQLKCHTLLASEDYKIDKEPKFVLANREYDLMHFKTHINPKKSFILRAINKMLQLMQIK